MDPFFAQLRREAGDGRQLRNAVLRAEDHQGGGRTVDRVGSDLSKPMDPLDRSRRSPIDDHDETKDQEKDPGDPVSVKQL